MINNHKKWQYDLTFVNLIFEEVVLYFKDYDEILKFANSSFFRNNCRYVISCYDYKKHDYIYILGGV